ncbi:hypothetical protein [Heliophilum fasciatum]|uniref:Stage VI sporulation protein F n=1 Tax=Heliophilum fasciatum TaxID=35700 RepID=A0A4R2RWU5_9FIRM|nr:hypothetical protein [Heliophilum fasciatum]MCW2277411.1 cytochrome c-type biogenesis protein CcmH/NrfF [Heliophilum fasciatum]TCP67247.1 hypothetical protein EDD73_105145 [Heliophilum fasciatum]
MDAKNVKDAIQQLLNQKKGTISVDPEQEKQVRRITEKLRQKESLTDDDRSNAVDLVSQFSKHVSPQQAKQLRGLIDQLMSKNKVSEKDQKALEQIKKML